ncbi:hypothetical protein [Choristoneura rosaceana nucleopolyhedrovirus]|uniref:Uncharacterized protein n=1 Tax=Choristoneura rosaceana nucleopolyhedrovirus TaxID=58094 RepID=S5NA54_9ABAC|nr:hypothetical protein [Choristoneura rosaceana nucleopolyhedrovirus]AGR57152.1 hypothetical protein [Choristoneura rosaceana nucleopolyhedrovirus]
MRSARVGAMPKPVQRNNLYRNIRKQTNHLRLLSKLPRCRLRRVCATTCLLQRKRNLNRMLQTTTARTTLTEIVAGVPNLPFVNVHARTTLCGYATYGTCKQTRRIMTLHVACYVTKLDAKFSQKLQSCVSHGICILNALTSLKKKTMLYCLFIYLFI